MALWSSSYIDRDESMNAVSEREKQELLQGKKQNPQATNREVASFWNRLKENDRATRQKGHESTRHSHQATHMWLIRHCLIYISLEQLT